MQRQSGDDRSVARSSDQRERRAAPPRRQKADNRKNEMLLRRGGCGLWGGFDGVDHDSLFAALRRGGVDRIQVDAFRCERNTTPLFSLPQAFCITVRNTVS